MNEDLLPDDNLIYQPFPDMSGKDLYLTFRRKIFPAYFITNFFDSLSKYGFINETSKEMIQNGIRLFYRHFLVTKEETLSQKELQNPMFCMLYRFLMKDDMGYDFNTDTAQWFKQYLFLSELIPRVFFVLQSLTRRGTPLIISFFTLFK